MEMMLENAKIGNRSKEGFFPVFLETDRGVVNGQYYQSINEKSAVVYVGGVGGGYDTPAKDLYPRLCRDLRIQNISGLRIQYRHPSDLAEAVLDVLVGVAFLESLGVMEVGLVGHSFGGAVVIQAATLSDNVKTVIPLSTQTYGAEEAVHLQGKSTLLIHGKMDEVLSPSSSVFVHTIAPDPKRLVLLNSASHGLDEKADEVYMLISDWMRANLKKNTVVH